MKTFVYHNGALGDLLLSLPCFARLKSGSALVHLAGRGDVVRFLRDAGVVDAATGSDQALFASLYAEIDPRLREFLSGFARAFVFHARENPDEAAAIGKVIPDTCVIRTIPPGGSQMHAARYRISQLDPDALRFESGTLSVPPEKAAAAQSLLRQSGCRPGDRLIALHPGSGGRRKCWPLERYFELIERLESDREVFLVLFTGEAEGGEFREAVRRFAAQRKNVLHAADLELTAAASLLSHCGVYIGNDSGFSHLAGALGCAATVLFGPTDPLCWRPLGPRVQVISTGALSPISRIQVEDVVVKIDSTGRSSAKPVV